MSALFPAETGCETGMRIVSSMVFCCVKIIWQQIFKGSLQIMVEGVLQHVTAKRIKLACNAARRCLLADRHVVLQCEKSIGNPVAMLLQI